MKFLFAGVLLAACNAGGGAGATATTGTGSSTAKRGSAGGFAASLTAELAEDNSTTPAGSAQGSAAPVVVPAGSGSSASAGSASAGSASAGSASAAVAKDPSAAPVIDKRGPVTNHDISKADTNAAGPMRPTDKYVHVAAPAELAAVKLDLEPNWDRDFQEAGTISFVLRVPNSTDTRLFSFKYGYDYPGAPSDRDAYKKFLSDRRVLDVTLDRQRGAAWYLEGVDAAGQPAFRYLVLYGGKRLVCYGSLYKTKDATALGADLRDKVVSTAKKICETIAL